MKIGVILPAAQVDEHGGAPDWRTIRSFAQAAESQGLDSVWMFDHFFDRSRPWTQAMQEAWTIVSAVAAVTSAVTLLGTAQATVGTLENRLQFAIGLAQSQIVNNKAAESRIRDANVAEESANMTRYNILSQSGIAALSQANQQQASVLALLR